MALCSEYISQFRSEHFPLPSHKVSVGWPPLSRKYLRLRRRQSPLPGHSWPSPILGTSCQLGAHQLSSWELQGLFPGCRQFPITTGVLEKPSLDAVHSVPTYDALPANRPAVQPCQLVFCQVQFWTNRVDNLLRTPLAFSCRKTARINSSVRSNDIRSSTIKLPHTKHSDDYSLSF